MGKKQTDENRNSDARIRIRYVLVLLAVIVTAVVGFVLWHIEDLAEDRLLDFINAELAPNAEIDFGEFKFSTFPAGLVIRDIRLIHNIPFEEHEPEKSADAVRTFEIERLEFSGINLLRMVLTRQWRLEQINISNMNFELVPIGEGRLADASPFQQPPPFVIGTINVGDARLAIYRERDATEPSYEIHGIHSVIEQFTVEDIDQPFHSYFSEFTFRSSTFQYNTSDGNYRIGADSVSVSSADRYVFAQGGVVQPLVSVHDMAEKAGKQTDRFDLKLDTFLTREIDLDRWFSEEKLNARSITIQKPEVIILRDKSYPREERENRNLPTDHLKELPFLLQVDSLKIDNGFLKYSELFPQENREGFVDFREINLVIENLQNVSPGDTIHVVANTSFLGLADLDLEGDFVLNGNADQVIRGSMSGFDLRELNKPLEEWLFVRVREGAMQHTDFYFSADRERAIGNLQFLYNNLEIRFLDEDTLEETRRRRLRSFFANRFAIRSDNTAEEIRTGEIDFERDDSRSAFNYWWKSIVSGLMDTVKR